MKKLIHVMVMVCLLVFAGCAGSGGKIDPKLEQGIDVIKYQLKPRNLNRSMYTAAFPNGSTATEYVSYLFSTMGLAEWPDSEEYAEMDPMVAEQAKAIRAPLSPKGVAFFPLNPDPSSDTKKQIVVKPNDSNHSVMIEAYEDPTTSPVKRVEQKIPTVKGDPQAAMFFQSNLEMGMTYQKF